MKQIGTFVMVFLIMFVGKFVLPDVMDKGMTVGQSIDSRLNVISRGLGIAKISNQEVRKRYDGMENTHQKLIERCALYTQALYNYDFDIAYQHCQSIRTLAGLTDATFDTGFKNSQLDSQGEYLTNTYDNLYREEIQLIIEDTDRVLKVLNNPEILDSAEGQKIIADSQKCAMRMSKVEPELQKTYKEIVKKYPI